MASDENSITKASSHALLRQTKRTRLTQFRDVMRVSRDWIVFPQLTIANGAQVNGGQPIRHSHSGP